LPRPAAGLAAGQSRRLGCHRWSLGLLLQGRNVLGGKTGCQSIGPLRESHLARRCGILIRPFCIETPDLSTTALQWTSARTPRPQKTRKINCRGREPESAYEGKIATAADFNGQSMRYDPINPPWHCEDTLPSFSKKWHRQQLLSCTTLRPHCPVPQRPDRPVSAPHRGLKPSPIDEKLQV